MPNLTPKEQEMFSMLNMIYTYWKQGNFARLPHLLAGVEQIVKSSEPPRPRLWKICVLDDPKTGSVSDEIRRIESIYPNISVIGPVQPITHAQIRKVFADGLAEERFAHPLAILKGLGIEVED